MRPIQQFNVMWNNAQVHSPKEGKVSGIQSNEYIEMEELLKSNLDNDSISPEDKYELNTKLRELNYMKNESCFNKADLNSTKPDFWEQLFSEEAKLNSELIISLDTMLLYNGGGIDAIRNADHIASLLQDEY